LKEIIQGVELIKIEDEDTQLQSLRLELKALEEKLQNFSSKKDEYLNAIDEFNVEYHLQLGDLIHDILLLEEQIFLNSLKEMEKNNETQTDDYSELLEEYEEFKEYFQEFNELNEDLLKEDREELDEEEKKELKKLFRKASKLCHPDIVYDELRGKATEIMKDLNDAYSKRDIKRVKEILLALKSGDDFKVASDTLEDKNLLKSKIVEIKEMIKEFEKELEEIKHNEAIKIMSEYTDIKVYFDELKKQLQEKYQDLKGTRC